MAAVIKELSSHLDDGVGAIFSSWSLYLLIAAGAATMLLASHALAAGPLAASQPGFTILDPLSASLLGTFLFAEHIRTGAADLAGEALALAAVIAAAAVLSHSCHVAGENTRPVAGENSRPVAGGNTRPVISSAGSAPDAFSAAAGGPAARADGAAGVRSGVRLRNRTGTAPDTCPRQRPGSTSPARVKYSRPLSPATASGRTTWPGSRRAAGWPRRRPSRVRSHSRHDAVWH
jgi:hypothetical protein